MANGIYYGSDEMASAPAADTGGGVTKQLLR